MEKMGLSDALNAIQSACTCETPTTFSFVVGAGISCPEVPLASEIIKELEEKCDPKELKEIESKPPMEKYSGIIYKALKNYGEIWKFFKEKVENARISISNLILAQLLIEKKVGKIVITPNFDDFLTRALSLFKTFHLVYDNTQSIKQRFRLIHTDIQILHVHGSYKFYDMCNDLGDILKNAKSIATELKQNFVQYPPIVIGYSGWKDDAIMKGLKEALTQKRILGNIYWFCYEDSETVNLPKWLTSNHCVVFVVPEKGKAISKAQKSENDGSWEIIKKIPDKLLSEEVFKAFLNEFKSEENKCFSNTLKHYETLMKESLPEKNIQGFFSYGNIIREIELAQLSLAEYNARMDSEIESLKHLLNNNIHDSILSKAIAMSHFNLNPSQIDDFLHILSSMDFTNNLAINSAEIIPGIGELFENLTKKNEYYFKIEGNQLKADVVQAELFGKLSLFEEEMRIYESIITNSEIENFIGSMKCLRNIKKNIFRGISKMKSSQEKLRFLDLFLSRYSFSERPDIQFYVVQAYYAKGKLLKEQSRMDEAIEAFEKLDLYENFHYPYLRLCLAKSWLDRGWLFKQKDEIKESEAAFEKVDRDFGTSEWAALRQIVEEAKEAKKSPFPIEVKVTSYSEEISNQWYSENPINEESLNRALNELLKIIDSLDTKEVERIRILDRIIAAGLGCIINPAIQIIHVKTVLKKAEMLQHLEENEKALKLYDEVERNFGLSEDRDIQDLVIESLGKKIYCLLGEADSELPETYYKLSLKYAKKGDKELCLKNIDNALYNGMPCSEIRYDLFLENFFKDDERLEELLEVYEYPKVQKDNEGHETLAGNN